MTTNQQFMAAIITFIGGCFLFLVGNSSLSLSHCPLLSELGSQQGLDIRNLEEHEAIRYLGKWY